MSVQSSRRKLSGVAVFAPEEAFAATGWVALDSSQRYFRHEARFGPAIFDRHEVAEIESDRRPPPRARPCLCRMPYGRLEEGICWKCGRRASSWSIGSDGLSSLTWRS